MWVLGISQLMALSFMVLLVQCRVRRTFTSVCSCVSAFQTVVLLKVQLWQLSGSPGHWVQLPWFLDIWLMLEKLNLWSDLVMIRNGLHESYTAQIGACSKQSVFG